jgi:hypothetical protein
VDLSFSRCFCVVKWRWQIACILPWALFLERFSLALSVEEDVEQGVYGHE